MNARQRIYFDEYGNEIDARPDDRPEPPRASAGSTLFNLACWLITAVLLAFLVGALGPAIGVRVPYLADVADAVRVRVQAPARCQINGADVPCADFTRLNNEAATAAAQQPAAPAATPPPQIDLRVIGPDGISAAAPAVPESQPAAQPPAIIEPPAAPVEAAPQPAAVLPQMAQDFVEAVAPPAPVEQAAPVGNVCLAYIDGRCPAATPAPAPAAPVVAPAAPQVGAQAFLDAVAGPTPAPAVCLAFNGGVCPTGGGK